MGKTY